MTIYTRSGNSYRFYDSDSDDSDSDDSDYYYYYTGDGGDDSDYGDDYNTSDGSDESDSDDSDDSDGNYYNANTLKHPKTPVARLITTTTTTKEKDIPKSQSIANNVDDNFVILRDSAYIKSKREYKDDGLGSFNVYLATFNNGVEGGKGNVLRGFSSLLFSPDSTITFPNIVLLQEVKEIQNTIKNSNYNYLFNKPDPNISAFNSPKANELKIMYHNEFFASPITIQTRHRFQIAVLTQMDSDRQFAVINTHIPKKAQKDDRDEIIFILLVLIGLLSEIGVPVACGGDFNHTQSEILALRKTFDLNHVAFDFANDENKSTTKPGSCIDHIITNNIGLKAANPTIIEVSTSESVNHNAVRAKLSVNKSTTVLGQKNLDQLYENATEAWAEFKIKINRVESTPFKSLSSRKKVTTKTAAPTKPKYGHHSTDEQLINAFNQHLSINRAQFFRTYFPENESLYAVFGKYLKNNKISDTKRGECRQVIITYLNNFVNI